MKQLLACLRVNFLFYRRNKIILVIGLALIFFSGVFTIPSLFLTSAGQKFDIIRGLVSSMLGFVYLFVPLMALMGVSQQLQSRSLKMVFTKPCSVETWIASHFLSTALSAAFLCLLIGVLGIALFFLWHVPPQWGTLYLALYVFFKTLILLSYLILLSTVFHPVIAAVVAVFLQEGLFFYAASFMSIGSQFNIQSALLAVLGKIFGFFYWLVPSYSPYEEALRDLQTTLRLSPQLNAHLTWSGIYALALASCCFLMASFILRKRNYT